MIRILKYALYISCLIFILHSCNGSQIEKEKEVDYKPNLPKKELRGVWIATVWGLDWPMAKYDEESQKQLYIQYLDLLVEMNMNAVFFQIRGMADAFYESQYEPWSKNITGVAGQKPSYDVMKFIIDEAHKRDIEFHAWLNPFRIATRTNASSSFPELDPMIPSNWVKDYNTIRVYNPALPEVHQRIVDIVTEIITKYDVDGIHMDDYFYPSIGTESMNDATEYGIYGKEFSSIEEFRRNNVNTVVKSIQSAIIQKKPEVVFSISPAASNTYNYDVLFADVAKWSQEGWVDLMIPQIYFATGTSESGFNRRLDWWSQFTYKSHLAIGYGIYKFGDPSAGSQFQNSGDIFNQFNYAATKEKVQGSLLYSAKYLFENKVGITDALKNIYSNKVLMPYLGRSQQELPPSPKNIRIEGSKLIWDKVEGTKYALYKDNGNGEIATLIKIVTTPEYILKDNGKYFTTAISSVNSESEPSKVVTY